MKRFLTPEVGRFPRLMHVQFKKDFLPTAQGCTSGSSSSSTARPRRSSFDIAQTCLPCFHQQNDVQRRFSTSVIEGKRIHEEDEEDVSEPTFKQKYTHGLNAAVPMVGFGLMDNTILIHTGDYIDQTVGVAFGFPTMVAAAAGQIVSDCSGVCFGGLIESLAMKLGLPASDISAAQHQLKSVKILRTFSAAFGVVLGCTLAMTQILFMDLKKAERLKAKKELIPLFRGLAEEAKEFLDCERTTLYLITDCTKSDDCEQVMYSMGFYVKPPSKEEFKNAFEAIDLNSDGVISEEEMNIALKRIGVMNSTIRDKIDALKDKSFNKAPRNSDGEKVLLVNEFSELVSKILEIVGTEITIPLDRDHSFYKHSLKEGEGGRVTNVRDHEQWYKKNVGYVPHRWRCITGSRTKSVLISPVVDRESGKVVGLLEAVNKHDCNTFTKGDEQLIKALASHAASVLASKDLIEMIQSDFYQ